MSSLSNPLPQKYLKALKLIEQGDLSYKDIATASGIPISVLYDLIEGSIENYGTIGERFTAELSKIQKRIDKEIRNLVKKNKKSSQYIIDRWLCDQKHLKDVSKVMPTVVSVANALSKSTPKVEIGSLSYTKGLSIEDLYEEFKRLSGLASDRGSVPGTSEKGTGGLPPSTRPRTPTEEEPEDPIL